MKTSIMKTNVSGTKNKKNFEADSFPYPSRNLFSLPEIHDSNNNSHEVLFLIAGLIVTTLGATLVTTILSICH